MFGNFVVRGPSPGRAWTFSELRFQRRTQRRDGRIHGTAALGTLAGHGIATGTDVVLAQQGRACQTQLALVVELPQRVQIKVAAHAGISYLVRRDLHRAAVLEHEAAAGRQFAQLVVGAEHDRQRGLVEQAVVRTGYAVHAGPFRSASGYKPMLES